MQLTNKQINEVATLARLELEENEVAAYSKQLSGVFEYVNQLNEVDISVLDPTAQVTGLENVTRSDVVEGCDPEIIKNALNQGNLKENQIKVSRII